MSDPEPDRPAARPPLPPPPPWLQPDAHAAMQAAYDRGIAEGHGRAAAVAAACAVLLAQVAWQGRPAADEEPSGVGTAAARSGGTPVRSGAGTPRRLDDADVADLVAALSYALRFDARGRPRRGAWDFAADLAAEWLAEHLRRSHFVVLRRSPGGPHSAG
jgi:hypothetical protein